jgi:hypothetical protein
VVEEDKVFSRIGGWRDRTVSFIDGKFTSGQNRGRQKQKEFQHLNAEILEKPPQS